MDACVMLDTNRMAFMLKPHSIFYTFQKKLLYLHIQMQLL